MTTEAPPLDESFAAPAGAASLERAAAGLHERGYAVHVVATAEEARKLVAELIPPDRAVFTASSETLRLSGITADVDDAEGRRSVRREAGDLGDDVDARIRLGALADAVVGSVHAVTEDGRMVVASASGSQLAPYASGARQAVCAHAGEDAGELLRGQRAPGVDDGAEVAGGAGQGGVEKLLEPPQVFGGFTHPAGRATDGPRAGGGSRRCGVALRPSAAFWRVSPPARHIGAFSPVSYMTGKGERTEHP
jgi:hypothetical protein